MHEAALAPAASPACWDAASFGEHTSWQVRLSVQAAGELAAFALRPGPARQGLNELQVADDALPRVRRELAQFHRELQHGTGVALVRGLPIAGLEPAAVERMCWAIGRLFGVGLAQNLKGELLGDVIDLSDQQASARPFQNGGGLIMHRDPVDVVGLLCVRHAKAGGLSRIVSACKIHDVLLAERRDLLERLYEGFVYHRLEEDRGSAGEYTPHPVPVFQRDAAGQVGCFFIPGPIKRAAREGHAMDALGQEALERFVALSERPDLYFDMNLAPGDLQLLNNRAILHGRTDYEDWPDMARRRYMLRLWLDAPKWAPLHPAQRMFEHADHYDREAARLRA
jgi:hypothetical protein